MLLQFSFLNTVCCLFLYMLHVTIVLPLSRQALARLLPEVPHRCQLRIRHRHIHHPSYPSIALTHYIPYPDLKLNVPPPRPPHFHNSQSHQINRLPALAPANPLHLLSHHKSQPTPAPKYVIFHQTSSDNNVPRPPCSNRKIY